MTSAEFLNSSEEQPEPLRVVELTQAEVLHAIHLSAHPMELDNETAIRQTISGLYTPTNATVLGVLDRLNSRTYEADDMSRFDHAEGDFLSPVEMRELDQLLKGVDDLAKRVEYTSLFMKSKHRKWMHKQRRLRK